MEVISTEVNQEMKDLNNQENLMDELNWAFKNNG